MEVQILLHTIPKNKIIKETNFFMMDLNANNISTIATWIVVIIGPLLAYLGYNIDQNTLIPIVTAIIGLIIAVWSSRNPNTISALGNGPTPIDPTEPVLNDEYESDGA